MKLIMENWRKHLEERIADQTVPHANPGPTIAPKIDYSKLLDSIENINGSEVWWAMVDLVHKAFCSTQNDKEECLIGAKRATNRKEIEEYIRNYRENSN